MEEVEPLIYAIEIFKSCLKFKEYMILIKQEKMSCHLGRAAYEEMKDEEEI